MAELPAGYDLWLSREPQAPQFMEDSEESCTHRCTCKDGRCAEHRGRCQEFVSHETWTEDSDGEGGPMEWYPMECESRPFCEGCKRSRRQVRKAVKRHTKTARKNVLFDITHCNR